MTKEVEDKMGEIVAKAWVDEEFKRSLIKNTTAVLKAAGIHPPEGYSYTGILMSGVNDVEIGISISMGPTDKPYYYGKIVYSASKP